MKSFIFSSAWVWAWIFNAGAIFVLCVWGRPLQQWVQEKLPLAGVGYAVTAVLAAAVLFIVIKQAKTRLQPGMIAAGLMAAALLGLTFDMKRPEEKVHLLLFGALGFISIRAFGFWRGLCICLALAGADELVQLLLPDRFGDFRDVGLNSAAAAAGGWLGRFWGRA